MQSGQQVFFYSTYVEFVAMAPCTSSQYNTAQHNTAQHTMLHIIQVMFSYENARCLVCELC